MLKGMRIAMTAAVVATALAGGSGARPAAAASYQFLDIQTTGCVTDTEGSNPIFVTMTCAATGVTDAAPTEDTAGELTYTVETSPSLPCPASGSWVVAQYSDAYGTITAEGGPNTWRLAGSSSLTGAPICQMYTSLGSTSGWSVWGTQSYSGMDETTTTFTARIPGITLPVSENEAPTETYVDIDVDNA